MLVVEQQRLFVHPLRADGILFFERGGAAGDAVGFRRKFLIEELANLGFRQRSRELVFRYTVDDEEDGRNPRDSELLSQKWILVDVDLREDETALVRVGE